MSTVSAPVLRNGFPFPIPQAPSAMPGTVDFTAGASTLHVFYGPGLTLLELAKLYWRTKKIRLTGSLGIAHTYPSGHVPPSDSGTVSAAASPTTGRSADNPLSADLRDVTSEYQLVGAGPNLLPASLGNKPDYASSGSGSDVGGMFNSLSPGLPGAINCKLAFFDGLLINDTAAPYAFFKDGLYYPQLTFDIFYDGGEGGGLAAASLMKNEAYVHSSSEYGQTRDITVLGKALTIPAWMSSDFTVPPPPDPLTNFDFNTIAVEAFEYFSYDGLYDTTTGNRM